MQVQAKFQNGMIIMCVIVDFTSKAQGTRIRNNVPIKGSHVFRVALQEPRMGFGKGTRILRMKVC